MRLTCGADSTYLKCSVYLDLNPDLTESSYDPKLDARLLVVYNRNTAMAEKMLQFWR